MTDFGGLLPRTAGELKSLPGIGDYTAGAIASIAYGEPAPAVDGNVLRVLSRLLRSGEDVAVPSIKARMTALLAGCYPSGEQAALLTEGLMELGETICIPNGAPRCELCPLRRLCLAREAGDPERYPVKTPKKARRIEERTILLLHCGGLWAIRRRERSGLLAGLWEFPNLDGCLEAREAVEAARELGRTVRAIRPAGQTRHVFTHVEWHMTGYLLEVEAPNGDLLWKTAGQIAESYPLPTALKTYRKRAFSRLWKTPQRIQYSVVFVQCQRVICKIGASHKPGLVILYRIPLVFPPAFCYIIARKGENPMYI